MAKIIRIIGWLYLVFFTINSWAISEEDVKYLPELRSAAWSPDLSKEDIYNMRLGIVHMAKGGATLSRKYLSPYIKDKKNIEVRYIYSLAIAYQVRIPEVLSILKELVLDDYPYAIETYGEERVCDLDKYEDICDDYGFKEVKKRAYLAWARKDPLVPDMYLRAFENSPNYGFKDEDGFELTDEATKILSEGAEAGCYRCAATLYKVGSVHGKENRILAKKTGYYSKLAKNILLNGRSGDAHIMPNLICYDNKDLAIEKGNICLTDSQSLELFDHLAKRGDILAYEDLKYDLVLKTDNIVPTLYEYIRGSRNNLPQDIKVAYDRAIELNNNRGWQIHGFKQSIDNWEKLYNDKHTRSFWDKVHSLIE